MIQFRVTVTLPFVQRIPGAIQAGQLMLDTEVLKGSNFYIPKDTGALEDSGILFSRLGQGHVGWNTPYAKRVYYGTHMNFSPDRNPYARALWFEEAKANYLEAWIVKTKNEFLRKLIE